MEKTVFLHANRFSQDAIKQKQQKLFGGRYAGNSLSQIRTPEWAQIEISKFLKKKKNFLVYLGNPGIGKTFLCSALVDWAMNTFDCWRYWTEKELLKQTRTAIDSNHDFIDTLQRLIDDEFIMIDDLCSCGLNDWRKEVLMTVVDERYNSMLPTLFTSNFSRKDFEENFHPRFVSRLFAKENIVIEIMDGLDHRNEP